MKLKLRLILDKSENDFDLLSLMAMPSRLWVGKLLFFTELLPQLEIGRGHLLFTDAALDIIFLRIVIAYFGEERLDFATRSLPWSIYLLC